MMYKVLIASMQMEIGGAETHVLELCKALKKKGVDVYVASFGGAYEQELKDSGIKHFKVPLHNKRLSSLVTAFFELKKIIVENDIKLVHAHARIAAFLCGLLQKQLKFRFVTTAHLNFKSQFPFNILSNWGEKSLAVSEDIKDYLVNNYNVNPENIFVTINGIDCDKFSPAQSGDRIIKELRLNPTKRHIVSVSRLDHDRNLPAHLLLELFEKHHDKLDCDLIIVGGGSDYTGIKEKADALNKKLGKTLVYMTGARTDMNEIIAVSDIFVNVSRSALEAMACGKPTIVAGNQGYIGIFDESKLADCVSTNFCCRGCGDATVEKLERDIFELLSMSKDELNHLGEYGRRVIIEDYSADRMADDALKLYETVRHSRKKYDVMLSGYYGSKNHGDDVILKSIIDDLREKKPGINITVLSKKPTATKSAYNVNAIYKFNFLKVYLTLRNTNVMITGGGTLLQDLTSTQSLLYYLWVINTAHRVGAKNMLYANGLGPLSREGNINRVKKSLPKIDIATFRDEKSYQLMRSFNVEGPVIRLTADPFFSLKNTEESEVRLLLDKLSIGSKYIVISIRKWKSNKPDFEQEIAAVADYVHERYGYEIIFVPMQQNFDTDISKAVISLMKHKAIFLDTQCTTNELLGIIAGAEFVIAMRLHMIIFSASTGTPVIGLSYDPKVAGMMAQIDQNTCVDVSAVDSAGLKTFCDHVITERESIKRNLLKAAEVIKKRADENSVMAMELIDRKLF